MACNHVASIVHDAVGKEKQSAEDTSSSPTLWNVLQLCGDKRKISSVEADLRREEAHKDSLWFGDETTDAAVRSWMSI